jgi:hypothetical protein
MSDIDSTNVQAPDFGPTSPLYPHLAQLVRVTGPALVGTNPPIYPCIVQQVNPATLNVRDRETAYVVEPNSITLGPAIYDTRLVGSYLNLPLYATTCCVGTRFGSSSSSSSGK